MPCWCFCFGGCEGGGGPTGATGGFCEGWLDVLEEKWPGPKHGGHLQKQQVQGEWRRFF